MSSESEQIIFFRQRNFSIIVPVSSKDMQTLLRSGHLDIKDAQCAETKDGPKISYYIILRLGAMSVQKGRSGSPKIQCSSKVAKFAG